MGDVKRYQVDHGYEHNPDLTESPTGDVVAADDYDRLEKKLSQAEKRIRELDNYQTVLMEARAERDAAQSKALALEAELKAERGEDAD